MAIDLTCYSKIEVSELQKKLDMISNNHPNIFPEHYVLCGAKKPHEIQKEISNEYGLEPQAYFIISLNNKALEISTSDIADMMRDELGSENIIVLLNGETII